MAEENTQIGYIIGGGLKENLRVRLTLPAQEVQEGAFVITESAGWQFYGLITDLALGSTDPRFADEQSGNRLPEDIAHLLHGKTLFTDLEMLPALMLNKGPDPNIDPEGALAFDPESVNAVPVKTVPAHHSPVRLASPGDIAEIFGKVDEKGNFIIGYTREQEHPVVINLEKFVKRSSGVFGATGTGKSFLTRLVLAGLINFDAASALILDMHNEYAFDDYDEDNNPVVGLKTKFAGKVQVVALGSSAQIKSRSPDFNLEVAMKDIQPQDIELLTRELNLKETTPTTLEALVATFGPREWFKEFKAMKIGSMVEIDEGKKVPAPDSVAAWANQHGVNVMAAEGLRSKLNRVFNLDYIVETPAADT
ncbi:MAG: ATP-binding protein, partial [Anaerolineae bacterium]|nr:ATP-binding protein [Anaerolineae bacterium]